jgi:hypothetical protein
VKKVIKQVLIDRRTGCRFLGCATKKYIEMVTIHYYGAFYCF